ncbi:MAG: hypothetical protein IJ083_06610 [Clostridia bacterium]|nr:hypothetical protein [Clostridia bacterium]
MYEQQGLYLDSYKLYANTKSYLCAESMTMEDRGIVFTCIIEYMVTGEVPEGLIRDKRQCTAWLHFKDNLDFNHRRDMARRQMAAGIPVMS